MCEQGSRQGEPFVGQSDSTLLQAELVLIVSSSFTAYCDKVTLGCRRLYFTFCVSCPKLKMSMCVRKGTYLKETETEYQKMNTKDQRRYNKNAPF